jgi:hypothetical protein
MTERRARLFRPALWPKRSPTLSPQKIQLSWVWPEIFEELELRLFSLKFLDRSIRYARIVEPQFP